MMSITQMTRITRKKSVKSFNPWQSVIQTIEDCVNVRITDYEGPSRTEAVLQIS